MAKELYLYSPIYDFTAQDLIASMEENKSEEIVIRSNTPGGSVFAGWGIIAKMGEMDKGVTIKVDGMAASMGLYMLLFADNVECLDVSTGVLHRADGYVSTPEDQKFLDDVNAKLKEKLTSKINAKKLKELKGVTIADIFNPETRIDVTLSAKEMKAIGLVDKINKVNPTEIKAFNERMFAIAAHTETKPTLNNMLTLEKIKAENPALYNEIFALGVAEGLTREKDRVDAAMVFVELDPIGVKAAIESGKPLSQKQMAEFSLKAISADALKKITADSTKTLTTEEIEAKAKTAEEKELSDFENKVKADLKNKNLIK